MKWRGGGGGGWAEGQGQCQPAGQGTRAPSSDSTADSQFRGCLSFGQASAYREPSRALPGLLSAGGWASLKFCGSVPYLLAMEASRNNTE